MSTFLLSNLAAIYASGIPSAAYMSSFVVLIYGCIWSTGDCYESKAPLGTHGHTK